MDIFTIGMDSKSNQTITNVSDSGVTVHREPRQPRLCTLNGAEITIMRIARYICPSSLSSRYAKLPNRLLLSSGNRADSACFAPRGTTTSAAEEVGQTIVGS